MVVIWASKHALALAAYPCHGVCCLLMEAAKATLLVGDTSMGAVMASKACTWATLLLAPLEGYFPK